MNRATPAGDHGHSGTQERPKPAGPIGARSASLTSNVPRLLTAEDLAGRWQVEASQVYRLTRSGLLPVVRLGRYYRYRLQAVEEFECDGGVGADG